MGLQVSDQNFLNQVARMAYGSSERTEGGRGNIGIFKDSQGRERIIKTDTHLFGAKSAKDAKTQADLLKASNTLRERLLSVAGRAGLDENAINDIRRQLGISEGVPPENRSLLERKVVAKVIAKIDGQIWQKAVPEGFDMRSYSSSGCDTDFKSVSEAAAPEGKASRVVRSLVDNAWGKLSSMNRDKLLNVTREEYGKLLNQFFGDNVRNFVKDHSKSRYGEDGITVVGREADFAALKETVEKYDEVAVGKYHCAPSDKNKAQGRLANEETFKSVLQNMTEEQLKEWMEADDVKRLALATDFVADYSIKSEELPQFYIEEKKGSVGTNVFEGFKEFLKKCVETAKKEHGENVKIDKNLMSAAALKNAVAILNSTLAQSIPHGVVNTINRIGRPDDYISYRAHYNQDHNSGLFDDMELHTRKYCYDVNVALPKNPKQLLNPETHAATIAEYGLKCDVTMNFSSTGPVDGRDAATTAEVIRETKWVMNRIFELQHPGATEEEHLQFVEDFVNKALSVE